MAVQKRRLRDLVSVGPAMVRDFEVLGVHTVAQLSRHNPERLYEQLCQVTGQSQDICVLDVFCAAVAQARNPRLPIEQAQWWYWSRQRKAHDALVAEDTLGRARPRLRDQYQPCAAPERCDHVAGAAVQQVAAVPESEQQVARVAKCRTHR